MGARRAPGTQWADITLGRTCHSLTTWGQECQTGTDTCTLGSVCFCSAENVLLCIRSPGQNKLCFKPLIYPSHLSNALGKLHAFYVFIFHRRFRVNLDRDLESPLRNTQHPGRVFQSQHKHRLSKILANITFLHPLLGCCGEKYGLVIE